MGSTKDCRSCALCGQKTFDPVPCSGCNSILFCNVQHMKYYRSTQHSETDCSRMRRHMSRHAKWQDDTPFPWFPKQARVDRCTLLKELKIHGKSAWKRECRCLEGVQFGSRAPYLSELLEGKSSASVSRLQLGDMLQDWWGNPSVADLFQSLMNNPLASDYDLRGIMDWKTYCDARQLPLVSPLPLLLDAPLTVFWAIQKYMTDMKDTATTLPDTMRILLMGPEKEMDQWPLFAELGSLLPNTALQIDMVGPEVPSRLDGKAVTICHTSHACTKGYVKMTFFKGTFQENMRRLTDLDVSPPQILIGQNAGLGAYPSWMPDLHCVRQFMMHKNAPKVMLFTDYIEESTEISRRNLFILFGPITKGCPDLQQSQKDFVGYQLPFEQDISSRISLTSTLLNPFRKPINEKNTSLESPMAPNAFGVFLSLA